MPEANLPMLRELVRGSSTREITREEEDELKALLSEPVTSLAAFLKRRKMHTKADEVRAIAWITRYQRQDEERAEERKAQDDAYEEGLRADRQAADPVMRRVVASTVASTVVAGGLDRGLGDSAPSPQLSREELRQLRVQRLGR